MDKTTFVAKCVVAVSVDVLASPAANNLKNERTIML